MNFALGCNHDEDDTQTGNELIANIFDESVYAEEVGLYSDWIGNTDLRRGGRAVASKVVAERSQRRHAVYHVWR
jgi:hypothetical protein